MRFSDPNAGLGVGGRVDPAPSTARQAHGKASTYLVEDPDAPRTGSRVILERRLTGTHRHTRGEWGRRWWGIISWADITSASLCSAEIGSPDLEGEAGAGLVAAGLEASGVVARDGASGLPAAGAAAGHDQSGGEGEAGRDGRSLDSLCPFLLVAMRV